MGFQLLYTATFRFQTGGAAGTGRSGRVAAFAGGIDFLAWAIGALLGGAVAEGLSHAAVGGFSLLMRRIGIAAVPQTICSPDFPAA